jgi:uncharacterized protein (TIGR02444 family)
MPSIHPFQTSLHAQSLWDFALAFYAQPQIAEACLQLQDQYRANVCLLLGLRWLDMREQSLSSAQLADLHLHTEGWAQQVIEPLRHLRRQLKHAVTPYAQDTAQEQLRTAIKHAELLAEQKLLIEIEAWVAHISTSQNPAATSNVARYLASLGAEQVLIELIQQ